MTDHQSRSEREALIAAGLDGALDPEQAAEVPMLADLLADPGMWAEPPAGLEDAVVSAVIDAAPTYGDRHSVSRHGAPTDDARCPYWPRPPRS